MAAVLTPNPMPLSRAAMLAFLLEAVFLGSVIFVIAHAATEPPVNNTVALTLTSTTDAAPPRLHRPAPAQVHHAPPEPHKVEPKPVPVPAVAAAAPVQPPAPTPVAPSAPQQVVTTNVAPEVQASFRSLIRAAIQAAAHDPYAARVAHLSGRVQMSFVYRDGRISGVTIKTSSGYEMIDLAARQAVLDAAYPAPPANLAGQELSFEMWVHIYQTES